MRPSLLKYLKSRLKRQSLLLGVVYVLSVLLWVWAYHVDRHTTGALDALLAVAFPMILAVPCTCMFTLILCVYWTSRYAQRYTTPQGWRSDLEQKTR